MYIYIYDGNSQRPFDHVLAPLTGEASPIGSRGCVTCGPLMSSFRMRSSRMASGKVTGPVARRLNLPQALLDHAVLMSLSQWRHHIAGGNGKETRNAKHPHLLFVYVYVFCGGISVKQFFFNYGLVAQPGWCDLVWQCWTEFHQHGQT